MISGGHFQGKRRLFAGKGKLPEKYFS